MIKNMLKLLSVVISLGLMIVSCNKEDIYKSIEQYASEVAVSKRFDCTVLFDCKETSDLEIIERRLELFDFKIISKENNVYKLNTPHWITDDFWDIVCSNYGVQFTDQDGNIVIKQEDVFSAKYEISVLKISISTELAKKIDDEELKNYYLSDGSDRYNLLCYVSQTDNESILNVSLFTEDTKFESDSLLDSEKCLFFYAMSIVDEPLHDEVNAILIESDR